MFDKTTNAVELVRATVPGGRGYHRVTGRDDEGRRTVPCGQFLFYMSAEGLRASPADIRHGFIVPLCERCFPGGMR